MRAIALTLAAGLALIATPALAAPEVSGEVGIVSEYITLDGFKYSDGPAAQAELDINFGACGLNVWGSKTLKNSLGDELESSLYCTTNLGEKTEIGATISHYAFAGDNMIVLEGSLSHELSLGTVDVNATQYTWRDNQDATEFQVGFSPNISEEMGVRAFVLYQTGFDLPDIVTTGIEASYQIHKNLSLRATFLVPVDRHSGDPRKARAVIGIGFTF